MLTVVTPPAFSNFCTLASLKGQLDITDSSHDAVLTEFIVNASAAVRSYCHQDFRAASFTETLGGFGNSFLMVSRTPIQSVSQITLDGGVVDPTTYNIEEPGAGLIFSQTPWFWTAELGVNVSLETMEYSEIRRYQVTYTAGYNLPDDPIQTNPLPGDIVLATEDTVKDLYLGRKLYERLQAQTVGALRLAYLQRAVPTGLSPRAELILTNGGWVRVGAQR